ncbi:MAG: acyl-CoA/acyl-ACP dehydrogenase [Dehalococcoidia bacterium]|nr:acyl-CoA/acyl-ACP dehydrogenase [Dehalococcoidia bacterium]
MTATDETSSSLVKPGYPTLLGSVITPEQHRLLERARTHAADFATRADEHDRENTYPLENIQALKDSGYAHMTMPKEFGGEDVGLLDLCACQEQLGQGCAGTAIAINMHTFVLGALQLDLGGSAEAEAMRQMLNSMVGSQKLILSGSFSETTAPGAYQFPSTKAVRVDGGWKVNGRKSYTSNFPAADMVAFLVHLVDHPDGDDLVANITVPKSTPGISSPGADSWDVMGVRASGSWDIVLEDVFVPDMMVRAPVHASQALGAMSAFISWFTVTVASVYLGVAQAAVDWTTNYISTRKPPTEERPLSHMPGMQYKLAEMIALNEASRGVIKRSAESWMASPWTQEEAGAYGATCKYIVSNNNTRVLDLAMDVAGGPGLFRRFGLERLYRDVRAAKQHPPSDMLGLEWIAKHHLGIGLDFQPRWA